MTTKKEIITIFFNIIVTFILGFYLFQYGGDIGANWTKIISFLSIITLIIQISSHRKLGCGIYDFIIYFFLFSHLFMFGNVYLIAIGKSDQIAWPLIFRYDIKLVIKSVIFVLLYLQIFSLGIIINSKSKIIKYAKNSKIDLKDTRVMGLVIFLLSLPFRLYEDVKNAIAAQAAGSYYAVEAKSGFSDDLAILFVPSIILLLNSSISKKKKSIITILFTLYSFLIMMLTGDRRYQFIGLFVVLLNYLYIINFKVKPTRIIIGFIFGITIMNFIVLLSDIRRFNLSSPTVFLSEYGGNLFSFDFFYKTLSEFGISLVTVIIAIKNIPFPIDYQNGLSIIGSIPAILPIGWLFPDFFRNVSIFKVLKKIEGYPVGASFPGELYANFGWFSLVVVFVFGICIARLIRFNRYEQSAFKTAQYFSVFYVLINIIRASFFEVTRHFAVAVIVPYLIYYLIKSTENKRRT